jgi:hypothetical protein
MNSAPSSIRNTAGLAGTLMTIINQNGDFRSRVDAIFEACRGEPEDTVRTSLVVALASQPYRGSIQEHGGE